MNNTVFDAHKAWDSLCAQYYQAVARFELVPVIKKKWDEGEHLFGLFGEEEVHVQLTLKEKMLASIEEFPLAELDSCRLFEHDFLSHRLADQIVVLLQNTLYSSDPYLYLPYPRLLQAMQNPMEGFSRVFSDSLKAIPELLRMAKSRLRASKGIVDIWLLAAIASIRKNECWLLNLPTHSVVKKHIGKPERLNKDIEQAVQALRDYASFLESDAATLVTNRTTVSVDQFRRNVMHLYGVACDFEQPHSAFGFSDWGEIEVSRIIPEGRQHDCECDALTQVEAFFSASATNEEYRADSSMLNLPGDLLEQLVAAEAELKRKNWRNEAFSGFLRAGDKDQILRMQLEKQIFCHKLLAQNIECYQAALNKIYPYLSLMAWMDVQLHFRQRCFSDVISELLQKTTLADEVAENLVFVVSRVPGFYFAFRESVAESL